MDRKTEEEVRDELRQLDINTSREFVSATLGVSASAISHILAGARGISDKVAAKMGYERKVIYERKEQMND